MKETPVTVIGLGAMGSALASAFLRQGHPTTVWNRSSEKAASLGEQGARRAATVAEAVAASPVAVVCLLDYRVVRHVLAPAGDALAGRVLVNLTNGTPRQARETAAWSAEHGADYLDGAIMAIPPMIGQPEALVLYSGSEAVFEARQHALGRLGSSRYLGADPGLASLYDLALLSGMYGTIAGFLQAAALVGADGIEATEFTTSLLTPVLSVTTAMLPALAQQIDARDYAKDVVSPLGMQAGAFANIVEASRAQGLRTDLLAPLQSLLDERVGAGHAAEDVSGLIELIRNPASRAGGARGGRNVRSQGRGRGKP